VNMTKKFRRMSVPIVFLLATALACAQTQIDLASQARHVDFSGAPSTTPSKVGSTLPSTCSIGEMFFNTSAAAGQNVYLCAAANTWSQTTGSGGGGVGNASQLADFAATDTSPTVQTIGAGCSSSTPCQIRTGSVIFTLTAPVTLTLSGTSAAGTVFWYLSSSQTLTVGYNSAATLTCSVGCSVASNTAGFPPDSTPLWQTTFTANTWDAINPAAMDKRAFLSRNVISAGSGVSSVTDPTTGIQTLTTDPTTVPRYSAGSGPPSSNCAAGRDLYTDTTGLNLYFCDATNTWKQANGGSSSSLTDRQTFVLASTDNASGSSMLLAAGANNGVSSISSQPAPGGLPNQYIGTVGLYGAGDFVFVQKKTSSTWSAAAGTVDVTLVATQNDGTPATGSWSFTFYIGCASLANGTVTFGTGSTVTGTPPSAYRWQSFTATSVNLPASCTAGSMMQFWVLHNADTGGSTGVNARAASIETVIRGNS
jgi:hypothetical protein